MSTHPRARLSSIVTEPFDPIYGWHDDDSPTHDAVPAPPPWLSPGFDPAYPFSPFQPPAEGGMPPMSRASFLESQRLQPTVSAAPPPPPSPPEEPDLAGVVSPVSPPRTAWRSERERERDIVVSPLIRPESFPARPGRDRDTMYRPKVEMEVEVSEPEARRSHRISRSGSMAQRLGRILSRRNGAARWSTVRRSRIGDEEYTELGGLEEADKEDAIAFDVSSFGAEFAVPNPTIKSMEEHAWNENMAYTGEFP
jgi:hypothetical protein